MALYMTQTMRSGMLPATLYYRKQSQPHPSHAETGAFTNAAIAAYAATHAIALNAVEVGNFRSGQGVPNNPNAVNI